jgi:NAD(P)-dependent dehydrogenase (short-subunit alcohol dehydrogenase family)
MKGQSELITKRLDGKIAVITGGNSGMGLATAQRFVQEGAYVFIIGRRQNELDRAVKQIGKNVTGIQGDVSNLEDLDRLYDTVKQQKGRINVLFANAGIVEVAPLGSITESLFDKTFSINVKGLSFTVQKAHFDKIFSVNVKGLLFTVQKALPLFQDGGSIILTASVGGSKGVEGFSVNSATKAAIRSFAHLDSRSEITQDPRERRQSWCGRHTGPGSILT